MTSAPRRLGARARAVVAAGLLACGPGDGGKASEPVFAFSELAATLPDLAPEHHYQARDGSRLVDRRYGGAAPVDLVLIHGSSAESSYLSPLAAAIAASGVARVITPDLRGHGRDPERRGDIDYIDQLEDDLADLIADLRATAPGAKRVIGGHSSGGGLAVRFAAGPHADLADAYLLLSPYLGHDAPTTRPDAGGWAAPKLARIIGLSILNGFGVTALNGVTVLEFNVPAARRSSDKTYAYSFRMMTGFNPRDHGADLDALCDPALVLVGSEDEALVPGAFGTVFAAHAPQATVEVIPGVKHLAIAQSEAVVGLAVEWLRALSAGALEDRCPRRAASIPAIRGGRAS